MIISFEQNADFYMDIAENARDEGDFRKALRYCGDAVARDPSAYNQMGIAMLYQDMLRHEYAIEECFAILDGARLDDEQLSDLYLLLSNSLGKLGYFIQSWYYLSKRADFDSDIEDEEDVKTIFEDICAKIEENAKSIKLSFSDEIREKQYSKCYREATSLFLSGDYKEALEYAAHIPPDAECYRDGLMLMSKCHIYNQDKDKAISCWKQALELNPNEGGAINGLAVFVSENKYIRKLIANFSSTREEDIKYVINAACIKGMYAKALELAEKLMDKDNFNPKYHFIFAAVKYNMGDKDAAQIVFKDILSLYYNKFPVEYMLNSFKRHKNISILYEHIPNEMINRIASSIRKELKAYGFKSSFMSSNAFRQAIIFALEKNIDPNLSIELLLQMHDNSNNAVISMIKNILIKPNVHFEIRRKLIVTLLDTLRRGRLRIVNENILTSLSLKTPPSYDDYSKGLCIAYCNAYAFLATVGIPFEKSLSKLVEKIYLSNYEVNSAAVLSAAISYMCVLDQNIFSVENIAGVFEADSVQITKEIANIQEAVNDKA